MQAAVLTLVLVAGQPQPPMPGQPVALPAEVRRSPNPPVFVLPFLWMVMFPALVAAAHAQQKAAEEEEVMPPDESGYEFKILRSMSGFGVPAKRSEALAAEAPFGWELFEVLDEGRLRLRRATSWRATDAERQGDPYRIRVGPGAGAQVVKGLVIAFIILGVFAAVLIGVIMAMK